MRIDQSNNDGFDGLLRAGLKNYSVKVPKDFTQRLLTRIQRQEYAAALAAVKLRERLLLAAMILLPAAMAGVMLLASQQIIAGVNAFIAILSQQFLFYAAGSDFIFRNWMLLAAAMAASIYILFDFVLAED